MADKHGSISYILNEKADIENEYTYDAFGNIISSKENVHNIFAYNGEQLDAVTGQYYLRARFYNPVIGRFTQQDTYHGDGLNLYAYCQNNPVMYCDPTGHDSSSAADKKQLPMVIPQPGTQLPMVIPQPGTQLPAATNYNNSLTGEQNSQAGNAAGDSGSRTGNDVDKKDNSSSGYDNSNGKITVKIDGKTITLNSLSDVWKLDARTRGKVIEQILANTEYADWWNCGAADNGYFPVFDFQRGTDVVSLKSLDPSLTSYKNGGGTAKIMKYIDDLNRNITVDGVSANRILDVRIPKGTEKYLDVDAILDYAKENNITIKIKEF